MMHIRHIAAVPVQQGRRSQGCMRHEYLAEAGPVAARRRSEGWGSRVAQVGVPTTIVADSPGCSHRTCLE